MTGNLREGVWGCSVTEPDDLIYVEKAVNVCRIRHMNMIGDTMNKLLGAYRRADRLSDAAKFLTGGVYFRLFPEPWHWEAVLLDMARKGKDEELGNLFQSFVAYEDRATRPRRESFYIAIRCVLGCRCLCSPGDKSLPSVTSLMNVLGWYCCAADSRKLATWRRVSGRCNRCRSFSSATTAACVYRVSGRLLR